MTIQEFRDEVIRRGIASVEQHETREHRRRGCLVGFALARRLDAENPNEWDVALTERRARENELCGGDQSQAAVENYWEYHCATAQVEHVYERLKVAWDVNGVRPAPTVSARAAMQYAEIVGIKPEEAT